MANDRKNNGPATADLPTPPMPPLMKGVKAGRNPGSVFGPPAPSTEPGPRGRLCQLLNLKSPTDSQLFEDAVYEIERLRKEPDEKR